LLRTRRRLTGFTCVGLACTLLVAAESPPSNRFQVNVDMVVQTFTVTDSKGRYVNGLHSEDIRVREDGVVQKIVAFTEGNDSRLQSFQAPPDGLADTKVFVLFDTSNWMYAGFAYASDAITDFVRFLPGSDWIAVYKFSRNLFRAASLTNDRSQVLSALRGSVAGDDTALYNALLLTLRDAAKTVGRKVVVVFSNGPDNASIVAPDDVKAVAEDQGIPIYVVSTREAQRDQITANAFQRLTARTGGQLFWAQTWQKQAEAFSSIREDLASSYSVAYYPPPRETESFRKISVDVISDTGKKYQIRTRTGYHVHGNSSRF
jgi:Ca-activated chloride channel family protein